RRSPPRPPSRLRPRPPAMPSAARRAPPPRPRLSIRCPRCRAAIHRGVRPAASWRGSGGPPVLAIAPPKPPAAAGVETPTRTVGVETTTAIERFERERKLPVTGQISDRLLRELAAVTGRPLE